MISRSNYPEAVCWRFLGTPYEQLLSTRGGSRTVVLPLQRAHRSLEKSLEIREVSKSTTILSHLIRKRESWKVREFESFLLRFISFVMSFAIFEIRVLKWNCTRTTALVLLVKNFLCFLWGNFFASCEEISVFLVTKELRIGFGNQVCKTSRKKVGSCGSCC